MVARSINDLISFHHSLVDVFWPIWLCTLPFALGLIFGLLFDFYTHPPDVIWLRVILFPQRTLNAIPVRNVITQYLHQTTVSWILWGKAKLI